MSNSDWTPLAGSVHYTEENETIADGDSSYVWSPNPGDIDTYDFDQLPAVVSHVYGIQTDIYARADDAGAKTIAPVIRQ